MLGSNGRVLYLTPAPFSVKIYSSSELKVFQKKGRFCDVQPDQLVFSKKRKKEDADTLMNKKTVVTKHVDAQEAVRRSESCAGVTSAHNITQVNKVD